MSSCADQISICDTFSRVSPNKKIAVIPGDGIGKDVIPQAVKVIEATGAAVELSYLDWGADRYLADGTTVPPNGFEMLGRDFDAIFVGAFGDPRVPSNIHAKEILLGMRFKMDLYANVRPVRLLDTSLCPLKGMEPKDIDFVVMRENTEGPYVDRGRITDKGTEDEVAIQEDVNTLKGVRRIIRYAFEYCVNNKKADGTPRSRVLMCDKSNAMTYAGGLWQGVFKEISAEYPQIKSEHMYVDALCAQMVRDPRQFDVIVTNNMFGDIITDLAAGLQGGLGMAASGNIHPGRTSMFEPVHGSAPPLAGKNIANPMGAILTAAMMLRHLGFTEQASQKIEAAVLDAVHQRKSPPASSQTQLCRRYNRRPPGRSRGCHSINCGGPRVRSKNPLGPQLRERSVRLRKRAECNLPQASCRSESRGHLRFERGLRLPRSRA